MLPMIIDADSTVVKIRFHNFLFFIVLFLLLSDYALARFFLDMITLCTTRNTQSIPATVIPVHHA